MSSSQAGRNCAPTAVAATELAILFQGCTSLHNDRPAPSSPAILMDLVGPRLTRLPANNDPGGYPAHFDFHNVCASAGGWPTSSRGGIQLSRPRAGDPISPQATSDEV